MQEDLFEREYNARIIKESPLAARMRPENFDEFVGQEHLIGKERMLRGAIDSGNLPSIIFWGPPGSGKTTLANIIARVTSSHFAPVSAVTAGVADLRRIIKEAKEKRKLCHQKTILFIDEIHRFNKAQQDAVLPFVEDGTITLIGATTENPSFEVISPLLSRTQVYVLESLDENSLKTIVLNALSNESRGLGLYQALISDDALHHLVRMANGDARIALNVIETAVRLISPDESGKRQITLNTIEESGQKRALPYDKTGEQHFDIISALHKSMRGSDPDASLFWLARMLEAGEDPLYIARRIVRFASEDVGMADPLALSVAMAAQQAVHFIGMPEGNLALAEAVVYMATSPKSNTLYTAYKSVKKEIENGQIEWVPKHLRNPVTGLMKKEGYGRDYKYAHDYYGHFIRQQNLPERLVGKQFYFPTNIGYEKEISDRIKRWWGGSKRTKEESSNSTQP
jgi:putative ATPase